MSLSRHRLIFVRIRRKADGAAFTVQTHDVCVARALIAHRYILVALCFGDLIKPAGQTRN